MGMLTVVMMASEVKLSSGVSVKETTCWRTVSVDLNFFGLLEGVRGGLCEGCSCEESGIRSESSWMTIGVVDVGAAVAGGSILRGSSCLEGAESAVFGIAFFEMARFKDNADPVLCSPLEEEGVEGAVVTVVVAVVVVVVVTLLLLTLLDWVPGSGGSELSDFFFADHVEVKGGMVAEDVKEGFPGLWSEVARGRGLLSEGRGRSGLLRTGCGLAGSKSSSSSLSLAAPNPPCMANECEFECEGKEE